MEELEIENIDDYAILFDFEKFEPTDIVAIGLQEICKLNTKNVVVAS